MARPEGLEPPTTSLEGKCSIHLSYGRGDLGGKPLKAAIFNDKGNYPQSVNPPPAAPLNGAASSRWPVSRRCFLIIRMPAPSFDLAGRRALVTGASQGIGLALARGLAAAGAAVLLNGRDTGKLDRARATLAAEGLAVEAVAFDVTDAAAIDAALPACGEIDILVNNAGIHRRGPLADLSLADWQAVLDTNLTAAFLVARAVVPTMIARRGGKIINVCSIMSQLARPTTGNYAAAKGGLAMLTKAMAAEWAPHGLQVNGLAPGYIDTPLNAPLVNDPKFNAWVTARTPSGRWGRPEDLAGPAVFLASPASNYINGQILFVDGGMTAVV